MSAPVAVELFCGCGGMSTGFLDAGIRVAAGFDLDRRSIEAYNYNHEDRGSRGYVLDLAKASGEDLLALAGVERIDALIGGPPCQPFSIVGKRRGRDDERSNLVFHFARLARELRPKAVFFENVPNLAAIEEGRLFQSLVSRLRGCGYAVSHATVAAADFGVPQVRRRLLLVGAQMTKPIELPEPTHGPRGLLSPHLQPYRTARDALDDLPDAGDFGECGVYNHEPTEHSADMLCRFAKLPAGTRERGSFHDRLDPDRPSYTLRAGTGNFSPLRPVHYRYHRVITARESARLQGFPDDFIWPDWIPRLQQYRQIGNAVPPPLGRAVALSLAAQLGWKLKPKAVCGTPRKRPPAITFTDDERRAQRRSRTRGASLGRAARQA
jgi:DNA (cytosine-5)-methyltransferase 1